MGDTAAVIPTEPSGRRRLGSNLALTGLTAVMTGVVLAVLMSASRQSVSPSRPQAQPREDVPAFQAVPAEQPAGDVKPVLYAVTYELSGGAGALNITYVGQGAVLEQERASSTPWRKSVARQGTEDEVGYLTVSAQNSGAGRLTCRILLDGEVVSERTAGPNGVVMCAKSIM
ncbi:MmpS family transport accessory protein [Amycolatopsis nigrescens]|uniref:MmpS family transport accessory protein n=1 Tax=Amycolatopsis nigrescens TaxID=381445 RepID=UPI000369EBEF|nr:MmpS family transport accessory protein [Amycolatopsis nigrescens]